MGVLNRVASTHKIALREKISGDFYHDNVVKYADTFINFGHYIISH